MAPITVKTFFGDDARRFAFEADSSAGAGDAFGRLAREVVRLYGLGVPPSAVVLQWADGDGDTINVTNTLELDEAVAFAAAQGASRPLARFRVQVREQPAPEPAVLVAPEPAVLDVNLGALLRAREEQKEEQKEEAAEEEPVAEPAPTPATPTPATGAEAVAGLLKGLSRDVGRVLRAVGQTVNSKLEETAAAARAEGGPQVTEVRLQVVCEAEGRPGHYVVRIQDSDPRPSTSPLSHARAAVPPFVKEQAAACQTAWRRCHARGREAVARFEARRQHQRLMMEHQHQRRQAAIHAAAAAAALSASAAAREEEAPPAAAAAAATPDEVAPAPEAAPAPAVADWVEVEVAPEPVPEAEAAAEAEPVLPTAPPAPYERELQMLVDMGFDREAVQPLVEAYRGNVNRIVATVLNQ